MYANAIKQRKIIFNALSSLKKDQKRFSLRLVIEKETVELMGFTPFYSFSFCTSYGFQSFLLLIGFGSLYIYWVLVLVYICYWFQPNV